VGMVVDDVIPELSFAKALKVLPHICGEIARPVFNDAANVLHPVMQRGRLLGISLLHQSLPN
jgi:hypothetical protein